MLKITSVTALVVGLLLAMPVVFADAEAGRIATTDAPLAQRGDRVPEGRIDDAFRLISACDALTSAACRSAMADIPEVTIELRDETHQISTLVRQPATEPVAP